MRDGFSTDLNESETPMVNSEKPRNHLASRKAARVATDAVFASMDMRAAEQFFAKRGFSPETIKELVANGTLMPEELLFMSVVQIRQIPFSSARNALGEIDSYRERLLGPNE